MCQERLCSLLHLRCQGCSTTTTTTPALHSRLDSLGPARPPVENDASALPLATSAWPSRCRTISKMNTNSGQVNAVPHHCDLVAKAHNLAKTELDDIASTRCNEHELIDNALRAYLNLTTSYKGRIPRWLFGKHGIDCSQPSTSKRTTTSQNARSAFSRATSSSRTRNTYGGR